MCRRGKLQILPKANKIRLNNVRKWNEKKNLAKAYFLQEKHTKLE